VALGAAVGGGSLIALVLVVRWWCWWCLTGVSPQSSTRQVRLPNSQDLHHHPDDLQTLRVRTGVGMTRAPRFLGPAFASKKPSINTSSSVDRGRPRPRPGPTRSITAGTGGRPGTRAFFLSVLLLARGLRWFYSRAAGALKLTC
jgi:hypothetical protein